MPKPKSRANGEGSIYFDKVRKKWVAELVTGMVGRRKTKLRCRCDTQKEARKWLNEQNQDHENGVAVAIVPDSLGEWLIHWVENIAPLKCKPSTLHFYGRMIRYADDIAKTPLQKVTPEQVQVLYGKLLKRGLSARSVMHIHRVLSRALEVAKRQRKVKLNVCAHVETPSVENKEMMVLTEEQARHFIEETKNDRLHAMFLLAIQLGLRMGECLGLRWQDIDFDKAQVHIRQTLTKIGGSMHFGTPKTKKSKRTLPLPTNIAQALKWHHLMQGGERTKQKDSYKDHGLVFATPFGKPLNESVVRIRHFKPALKRGGCPPIRFHDLRHTAVTFMRQVLKLDLETIAFILGHGSPSVTQNIYSHLFEDDKKKVAQALDGLWTTQ